MTIEMGAATYGIPHPRRDVDPADTRALVEAAQAGDRDAFGQLYRHYHETVFRFVYYRIGNRQTVEDITGDTFYKALRSLSQFTWQGKDFGAWLVTIARNRVADHFKSARHRTTVAVDPTDRTDNAWWVPDADRRGDPAEVVELNDLSATPNAALAELTEQQRQVLALRFGAGLQVDETARWLGVNEAAVKALQYRACQSLRRFLGEMPR